MDPTHHYYTQHAAEFFHSTVGVDMAPIRQRFIARLPPGGHILDAGCGSGRDARAFAEAGFRVTAFDASAELARLASAHCGFEVVARRFEDVDEVAQFDGIWCCASLLHVPLADMPETLARVWTALRPGGTLYVSFEHGSGEREHGGRRFTDADEARLRAWFDRMSQNSTTPESKRGQEIIEHVRRGLTVHLFVGDGKLAGGKAARFVYRGRAAYESHLGSGPINVVSAV